MCLVNASYICWSRCVFSTRTAFSFGLDETFQVFKTWKVLRLTILVSMPVLAWELSIESVAVAVSD
jgi:hypothetical protein